MKLARWWAILLWIMSSSHPLDAVRVSDCMHHGILSCDQDAPLSEVASIMGSRRIHAVAVYGQGDCLRGIVSDLDVVAAAGRDAPDKLSAKDVAATEAVPIASGGSLREAAQLLSEHGVSHLVVIDESNGHPTGVLSTTDILSVYGSFTTAA